MSRTFTEVMAEVLAQDELRLTADSPMGTPAGNPWGAASALAVPAAVPYLIEVLERGLPGATWAVGALETLGPAARAAGPVLERLGEHLALWRVDEARARELGVHRLATAWRSGAGQTARAQLTHALTDDDRARAHFDELVCDRDPQVVLFALDALRKDGSGLFARAWDRPNSVPLPSLRPRLSDADFEVVRAAARLVMRLHHPGDAEGVLAAWERTLFSPIDVAWLAPHPKSYAFYDHVSGRDLFELVRRRRCAGFGTHLGGGVEHQLSTPTRDADERRWNERTRGEIEGRGPPATVEAADELFVTAQHEHFDPDASASGRYANLLLAQPDHPHAAFQLAWIDREFGSPIAPERVAWLRQLGVHDEALLGELSTPVPPFSSGPRTRNTFAPGTKADMRAHLDRVRRATAHRPTPVEAPDDSTLTAWRVTLSPRVQLADYDVDAFAVEHQAGTDHLDFRLELGSGFSNFWALPAKRDDRLRLVHVSGAGYDLEAPQLVADPWVADLGPFVWEGELARIDAARTLVRVAFEASASPARYRCDLRVRHAQGRVTEHSFAWQGT